MALKSWSRENALCQDFPALSFHPFDALQPHNRDSVNATALIQDEFRVTKLTTNYKTTVKMTQTNPDQGHEDSGLEEGPAGGPGAPMPLAQLVVWLLTTHACPC